MEEFDGHVLGTRLHNPDFVALAHSFGANGVRAEDANALHAALSEAVATENDKPVLIEVPVGMLDREF
jgi:acetolactate synthase-1/2/3 large subunit